MSRTFKAISCLKKQDLHLLWYTLKVANTDRKVFQKPTQDEIARIRKRKHGGCIRSNGNARKRHETGNGNTGYPSCFRNGLTCFCHVSVYGFLQFRPVLLSGW